MTRADQLLVKQGLAPTRSAAQRLIDAGVAEWQGPQGWAPVRKAGEVLPEGAALRVTDDAETRWVSRAGLKLEGALDHCAGLDVLGARCLDVGQSTGGFTEVLLARGAVLVVGVDVGHGQLHPRLQGHDRLVVIEGLNARELSRQALLDAGVSQDDVDGGFDVVVGDLSFISLTLVLPALVTLLTPRADLLLLVKPQFELQPSQISKGGLVKDESLYAEVRTRIEQACQGLGLRVVDYFDSPIAGGDGNREFFVWARPTDKDTPT